MKALFLNAGGKNDGATQEILLTMQACVSDLNDVTVVCLGDLNINYCKGCITCYQTCKCVISDDMQMLINEIDCSDIIVIVAPSYWADISGQFKVFIDRCTVYSETNPNPNHLELKQGKKCYTVALRRGDNPVECNHIIDTVNHWCGHMKIEMLDSMYFCGIATKDDVSQYKEVICEKAKRWFSK